MPPSDWEKWLSVAHDNTKRLTRVEEKIDAIEKALSAGIITWKQLVGILLIVIGLLFGGMWSMLQSHASTTHKDAATIREYQSLQKDLNEVEKKVDTLIEMQLKNK